MKYDISNNEIEALMKILQPEKEGVETRWYKGIYVISNDTGKHYGVKRVISKALEMRNCPAHSIHNFNSHKACSWLKKLGFTTESDETITKA